jgi:hypothetical protein
MDNRVARIARHVKHFKVGHVSQSRFGKFATVHSGHHNVSQKQVERTLADQLIEGSLAVCGLHNGVSKFVQSLRDIVAYIDIILADEDPLPFSSR